MYKFKTGSPYVSCHLTIDNESVWGLAHCSNLWHCRWCVAWTSSQQGALSALEIVMNLEPWIPGFVRQTRAKNGWWSQVSWLSWQCWLLWGCAQEFSILFESWFILDPIFWLYLYIGFLLSYNQSIRFSYLFQIWNEMFARLHTLYSGDRAGERLPSTESWTKLAKDYALMVTGRANADVLYSMLGGFWYLRHLSSKWFSSPSLAFASQWHAIPSISSISNPVHAGPH